MGPRHPARGSLATVLSRPVQEGIQSGPKVLAYLLLQRKEEDDTYGLAASGTRQPGRRKQRPRPLPRGAAQNTDFLKLNSQKCL